jgi:DNA-binding GntR family transcriptional regulator
MDMAAREVDPFGEYAYVQVADDIQRRITTGEFSVRLPGERSLADEYGVAYTTVRHAFDILRERQVIRTAGTRGAYIQPQESWTQ